MSKREKRSDEKYTKNYEYSKSRRDSKEKRSDLKHRDRRHSPRKN
jgi:hypothetical protein